MSPLPAAPPPGLRAWAEIDLAALERNLGRVRACLPPHLHFVAVVKADAYGHGAVPVATRLMLAGADLFAVANVREAAELRELGSGWPILVLGPLLPEEDDAIAEYGLTVTLSSADELKRWQAAAQRARRQLSVHLKIDTGMGRAGVWHEQAIALAEALHHAPELRLDGVFTHFACADTDPVHTARQRQRFLDLLPALPGLDPARVLIHADNSAGMESFAGSGDGPFNAVRIGLLQFGIRPTPGSLFAGLAVEPVFSFHTRVGLLKDLPAGAGVGYGQTCRLDRPTRIAVLTAGYADGLPTSLSGRGEVLLHGQRCRMLGRVSMDQTVIDANAVPAAAVGDRVTLIGHQGGSTIDVQEFSHRASSIPWETFCQVSKRVTRVYRTDTAV